MKIDKFIFERLWWLQTQTGYFEFKKIFNPNLAKHLWMHYSETYRHNLMSFWGYLDEVNRELLLKYINSEEFIETYIKRQGTSIGDKK